MCPNSSGRNSKQAGAALSPPSAAAPVPRSAPTPPPTPSPLPPPPGSPLGPSGPSLINSHNDTPHQRLLHCLVQEGWRRSVICVKGVCCVPRDTTSNEEPALAHNLRLPTREFKQVPSQVCNGVPPLTVFREPFLSGRSNRMTAKGPGAAGHGPQPPHLCGGPGRCHAWFACFFL